MSAEAHYTFRTKWRHRTLLFPKSTSPSFPVCTILYAHRVQYTYCFIVFNLQPIWAKFDNLFVQYSQSDLPPLRPLCGEAPGRDSNPGRADLVAGTLTIRPPHLVKIIFIFCIIWQNFSNVCCTLTAWPYFLVLKTKTSFIEFSINRLHVRRPQPRSTHHKIEIIYQFHQKAT